MKRPNAKVTEKTVRLIHDCKAKGWTVTRLAREFELSGTQVGNILSGRQWQDVWREYNDPDWAGKTSGELMEKAPELSEEQIAEMDELFNIGKPPTPAPDEEPVPTTPNRGSKYGA